MPAPRLTRPERPERTPLAEVLGWVGARLVGSTEEVAATVVSGISLSSQRVQPGDLYVALPGARDHGARYSREAAEAGAVAVLTDEPGVTQAARSGLPVLVVGEAREVVGVLSARVYGEPALGLRMMAVTGTQGKTTTCRLLAGGLEQAGIPGAVIGTIGTRIAGVDVPTALTTPEAPDLQGLFAVMGEQQVEGCVMEVSSHALVLHRVDGIRFDVAAFANLGRDHLDFHKNMEDYFAAKASLFTPGRARLGLTNIDDPYGRRLLDVAQIPMRTFSPSGQPAHWRATQVRLGPQGSRFTVVTPRGEQVPAGCALPGEFNVANALCAIAVAAEAGFDVDRICAGVLAAGGVPGRLERIDAGQDFLAVVDYAHKPDALQAALMALRKVTTGRLILVLGAGGDRDTGKRPLMGEIGARLADVMVVTDDNPRSEDPAAIRAAVLGGAQGPAQTIERADRGAAIRAAIAMAAPGDTVLVAGKGHETGQEVSGVVHPFDDRDEVRAALEVRR